MSFFKNRKHWVLALVVLLLTAGIAWAMRGYQSRKQLAKVKEMGSQLMSADAQKLSPQERRSKWGEFRKESEKLSPAQKESLSQERRQAAQNSLKEFFKLPKKEQNAKLDRDIKQGEARRREFEKMSAQQGGNAARGGQRGQRMLDPDKRDQRARSMLDRTNPEERAMRTEYRRLIGERRRQLGLPPRNGGGGRRG